MRPEDTLHAAVVDLLRYAAPPPPEGPWWSSQRNELAGASSRGRARTAIAVERFGVAPGAPDIHGVQRGRAWFMELKADDGSLSAAQRACRDWIKLAGGAWAVVRSLDDARAFLAEIGVPLKPRLAPPQSHAKGGDRT